MKSSYSRFAIAALTAATLALPAAIVSAPRIDRTQHGVSRDRRRAHGLDTAL
jgi:hypothetical protein